MLYKRGTKYWVKLSVGGKTLRETTGTADKKAAEEFEAHRAAQLWREHKLGERVVYWDAAAADWLEQHAVHKKSYANDVQKIRWASRYLTGLDVGAIDTEKLTQIRDAKRAEGHKAATANRHLATISAVLHYAHERGWLPSVPKLPYLPEPRDRILWITRDQASALLAELPPHLERMARLALATGLRRANVTGLKWSALDLTRRVAWVHAEDAKAGKSFPVPLNDDAIAVLRECRGDDPVNVFIYRGKPVMRTKTKAWDKAVARAGLPDALRWHDLRHTWASWHVMAGTPLEVLMRLGGWASLDMVLVYAHLAPGYLAGYADAVNFGAKQGTGEIQANEEDAKSLIIGVADGVRTHDNWNHNPSRDNVVAINQEVADGGLKKSRGKQG